MSWITDLLGIKEQTDKIPGATLGPIICVSETTPSDAYVFDIASTINLPSITIKGIPAGATILFADVVMAWRQTIELSAGENWLSALQYIQARKAIGGAWTNAIALQEDQLYLVADQFGPGDAKIGTYDVSAQVPANGEVMEFQWLDALAFADGIELTDLQMMVRIYYHM